MRVLMQYYSVCRCRQGHQPGRRVVGGGRPDMDMHERSSRSQPARAEFRVSARAGPGRRATRGPVQSQKPPAAAYHMVRPALDRSARTRVRTSLPGSQQLSYPRACMVPSLLLFVEHAYLTRRSCWPECTGRAGPVINVFHLISRASVCEGHFSRVEESRSHL